MSKEENLAVQEKLGAAINNNDFDALDDIFSVDVIDHDPAKGQGPGPSGFKDMFHAMKSAFPDLKIKPDYLVADDNNVSVAYTITGTHQGDFQDLPATGKTFSARGVQIARFEEDKIVERWGSSDELGILKQLKD